MCNGGDGGGGDDNGDVDAETGCRFQCRPANQAGIVSSIHCSSNFRE